MDENNKLNEEITTTAEESEQDKVIREAIEKMASQIRNEALIQGARMMGNVIMDIMSKHLAKAGKKSLRDYERMTKEIYNFVSVALKRNDDNVAETEADADEE